MQVKVKDFNLSATIESGQVFGFSGKEGIYSGAICGNDVTISETADGLEIVGGISETAVRHYFDLERDLEPIYDWLDEDERLCIRTRAHGCAPLQSLKGLRLIRQDSWEALACFIISSNNNVKRIQGIWKNLSGLNNRHIRSGARPCAAAFPSASDIARCHERKLRELGLGYRAPFLQRTAQFVSTNPQTLDCIHEAPYEEAKARVLAFPGIGEKVADCVLLYGFQKYEAFPVDVWIARIMQKLYFKGRRADEKKVRNLGRKKWGPMAGYVQQYLFHGIRTGLL